MKPKELLDRLYRVVESVILQRQHPVTGLLPASTSVNTHGDYTDAWVRDNVYSIISVWSLGLAYRRVGESIKSDEMEQATIKLMRGLLESMMRQSSKVETFKHTLNPIDALHAKYDTATGLPVVADHEWGHLQIDATSLFLLMVGQMTASGLRIIRTYSEVDFIQNLIYYIASANRTPDFGIWERGNKINNGKPEINASSLGMAKAALQALDGFNLFGENASPRAVVHTVADAISLARSALATLLPRESLSKEVDSALLSIIGFPAFAVGDEALVNKTRDEILAKLGGNYGCKRFLWDGHQTVVEESSRIYYEHSELANFENIESEWPLFYTYLYLNALFNGNEATAKYYRDKIEDLMVDVDGVGLIPELYYLPRENIAEEKANPRSQSRVPNENVPLVWAQSLYLTGVLLDEGLLTSDDLDPLKMRRRTTRSTNSQIALVVLAENDEVKKTLAKHGVISESIEDIKPMGVISAPHLVEAYAQVGANDALGLTGRPTRRLQSLSTSQTYDINNNHFLCLSWLQSSVDDYRGYDGKRTVYNIKQEIDQIRTHWLNNEVAVFTFMMEQRHCNMPDAEVIYETFKNLQLRTENENVGYASAQLAYRASRSNKLILPKLCVTPLTSSVNAPKLGLIERMPAGLKGVALEFVSQYVANTCTAHVSLDEVNYASLKQLVDKHALTDTMGSVNTFTLADLLELVYAKAREDNHWLTARYCFSILGRIHAVLADGMPLLSSRFLSVTIGTEPAITLSSEGPFYNQEIARVINGIVVNPLERTLVQEALAVVGSVARTRPKLLEGLRSIKIHNLLALCIKCEKEQFSTVGVYALAALPPSALLEKIRAIFESQRKIFTKGIKFNLSQKDDSARFFLGSAEQTLAVDTDWLEWRSARGLFTRFDEKFLKDIWQSLSHTKQIIFGDLASQESSLDSERTQSSMTPGEESFAGLIDRLTQHVHPPYYKSALVETLYAFTQYCKENKDVSFGESVDLGEVLEEAATLYITVNAKHSPATRDLDVLLQKSPFDMQQYLMLAFSKNTKA